MKTPVAFLVFNRPEQTAKTLAVIRAARPPALLVIADGPRPNREGEAEKCNAVRKIISEHVDWPCDLVCNYSESNLGCAKRVSSGLDWAFGQAESLIVLEDDCLPDLTFFQFSEELLARYSGDRRIGQICGCCRHHNQIERDTSYIFSRYGPIWGWASWRRAWSEYDLRISSWPQFRRRNLLRGITRTRSEYEWRLNLYDRLHSSTPDTWDYQWGYAKMSSGMLSVIPCLNLIENIGFGDDATHTHSNNSGALMRTSMKFPLIHPQFTLPDAEFDADYSRRTVRPGWRDRLVDWLK